MNTKYDRITGVIGKHLCPLKPNSKITNLVITQQFRTSKTQAKLLMNINLWEFGRKSAYRSGLQECTKSDVVAVLIKNQAKS
ncbi:hypothetical protein HanIR_Chr17g0900611 [Helianthus annuus]|nr:hypothetical protein HanIR_Chr17g0900611 [Helianthus annuus]